MTNEYRKYNAYFKADIAFMAIKDRKTIKKISKKHNVSCEFIIRCKNELLDNAYIVFKDKDEVNIVKYTREEIKNLHKKIGQFINGVDHLTVEIELLKRNHFK